MSSAPVPTEPSPRRRRVAPLAAAILAAVVLASSWVLRLSGTLVERSQAAQVAVTGSTAELTLVDDAGGVPLLDDVVLEPGETVTRCIGVETRTLADPDPLVLHLEAADSPLAEHLWVELAGGARRGDDDCTDLEPATSTSDTLAHLLATLAPDQAGWTLADPPPGVSGWWYRIDVALAEEVPDQLLGSVVEDLTLRWSSSAAERRDGTLTARAEAFVLGTTEDAATPFVLLVVGALLFLGVHDRIDADDPKLALAPVDRRLTPFTDRATVGGRGAPARSPRDQRPGSRDHRGPSDVPPPPPPAGPGTA